MRTKAQVFFPVLIGFYALDQLTKAAVYFNLTENRDEIVLIPNLLSIVHVENPAAAFGMLGRRGPAAWPCSTR